MFLHSYINSSSTKKLPLVDTLISGTRQLDFDQFLFYYINRSGVGLFINFRHRCRAILLLFSDTNFWGVPVAKLSQGRLIFIFFRANLGHNECARYNVSHHTSSV